MADAEEPVSTLNQVDLAEDSAVAEGGAYEVIRKRLELQGQTLSRLTRELNQARLEEFGSSDMQVLARVRVRTEHNCIARDIVQIGDSLLFGYNVFIGLKKEIKVADVFSLFTVSQQGGETELSPLPLDGGFLTDSRFVSDFEELYRYYKHTRLLQLSIKNGKLLAGFQIGEQVDDIRVFRWSISPDGQSVEYIDNRGERDIQLPPAYDFEWQHVTRDDVVHGRHSHLNILDTVFVETLGGDLTIKIENNTEDGLGIYRESVEDATQSIDDAQFEYARVGQLILLKIRPYKENAWRYFVFNTLTEAVTRIDAIGASCVQLPEDHGVIFPGGYYLESGEYKTFDNTVQSLRFKRVYRSPNGEDVLYVFYEPEGGVVALFAYNIIEKTLQNPIYGHGYALADNGQLTIFSAESEATRVHPMQLWQTPYVSDEFASHLSDSQSFYGRIGNAELVRGISDFFAVARLIDNSSVSLKVYEELSKAARKLVDDYFWLENEELSQLTDCVNSVVTTAELIIDEFEKVESIRRQSAQALQAAENDLQDFLATLQPDNWETVDRFVDSLRQLRLQRGHLVTIRDHRYINVAKIDEMDTSLQQSENLLCETMVAFLSDESALDPYHQKISVLDSDLERAGTVSELSPVSEKVEQTAAELDLLTELLGTLKVQDATVRTQIIEGISAVYSTLNQIKANARLKEKTFGSVEAKAQFGAQFKLFSQSVTNALGQADAPEQCDEQLARLLVQLEELESQFGIFEEFLSDILAKREEVYEAFENHKQQLVDERQRRAQSLADAAARMLSTIEKRSLRFTNADELNTFYASDVLATKIRDLIAQLYALEAAVMADDISARFKAVKEQALRALRDKADIFEDGGNVIKLGPRHRFSVNNQELDITLIPREDELTLHLTGTQYYESIDSKELNELRAFWSVSIPSESDDVYRAEYLSYLILNAAKQQTDDLSEDILRRALLDEAVMQRLVTTFANPRYREGYEKGVHDHDAALILTKLIPAIDQADLLRYDPASRALAQVFWANQSLVVSDNNSSDQHFFSIETWAHRAQSARHMQLTFGRQTGLELLVNEIYRAIHQFVEEHPIPCDDLVIRTASHYLADELSRESVAFIGSRYAAELVAELKRSTDDSAWKHFQSVLKQLIHRPLERWQITSTWFEGLVEKLGLEHLTRYIPEATAMVNADERIARRPSEVDTEVEIDSLLGEHKKIENRKLRIAVDNFWLRLERHTGEFIPNYERYQRVRHDFVHQMRDKLQLGDFKARPLSSFVRNQLINEAYLPVIGDNLAKQMGTVGDDKRTDLMGLLMMISPPGYGKTTLMEYVANRLGLIFMKINCPSLGHEVLSLDPQQAPNATAVQELNKLNLALEMGNNVMLYLDDIQHTHPEFLQKFISLCDGSRRIEGVWQGKSKTYDLRGRKFCVVMAGNPYTESGEVFKIPDMLANRADIYNLGDILGGMDAVFALSYVENCLTSNAVLAPLATREMSDVYKLVAMAKGEQVATTDLSYSYSGAEINEIVEVLKKLFVIQALVLKVNQAYISSAAQDDRYRVEPPFKLQGSYRNMNKMAEKVTAIMNEQELQRMLDDHYQGESQLLTTGAEANLLKLAELRGTLTDDQSQRWKKIKLDFVRNQQMGEGEVGDRVVTQLVDLVDSVKGLENQLSDNAAGKAGAPSQADQAQASILAESIDAVANRLDKLMDRQIAHVEVTNPPVPGIEAILRALADAIENSLTPVVKSMEKKLDIDLRTHEKLIDIAQRLKQFESTHSPNEKR